MPPPLSVSEPVSSGYVGSTLPDHDQLGGSDAPWLRCPLQATEKTRRAHVRRVPHDTVRDPRGFALKFYTDQGNYDMVGNNTPIFFIRDPQKFSDFIHSQKRRADTHTRDNNMQWDFWTLSPESAHMVTWLMGDRGIPKTWRNMNGYSSHTYQWINAGGEKFWVKYHFKTDQGIEFLTQEEADRLAGESPDYHRQDLFEAIRDGDLPSWTLYVQIMPFEEGRTYRFNPFD